jgi:hypothetical protein
VDGVIAVGDKLELEPSFFLGDRWHINQTYPKNNSPLFARSKQIVMFGGWQDCGGVKNQELCVARLIVVASCQGSRHVVS